MSGRAALATALRAVNGSPFEYAIRQACEELKAAGYAIVPREATEAQADVGEEARKSVSRHSGGVHGQTSEETWKYQHRYELAIYRAMVAAAEDQP